ncbi:TolC family protein [Sphingobacterium sp. InxBP1]|uniref:Type I secretion outer membrane protein, TolC family n=2 Tax=Sphingobacteriaceae TaxID=84566 RepID=A0A4U9V1L8_9SPHI|nr:TolC family protein [Sphingobacterium sp. InxBP1]VTR40315.1 type I secretion outer membrane protein, TolC family [Sphingobacterium thalpophilum]
MNKKLSLGLVTLASVIGLNSLHAQSLIDPSVKDIIQRAFQTNKELKLKTYEVDKARLEAEGVKANKLPHVSALGLYGYVHSNGSVDIPTVNVPLLNLGLFEGATGFSMHGQAAYAGVSVRQIIFSGLQIPNGIKALKEKALAQQYLESASRETLSKDIIASFDQLMLLDEVDKLIADSEKRLKKEQEKVNKAIQNGLAIPYDRDKLKLALLELEEKKVEVAGNRDLLCQKIQQETSVPFEEVGGIHYTLQPIFLTEIPDNVDQRSELKALEASSKAYEYLYKKEKGGSLPAVFAFGSANYLNVFNSKLSIKDQPLLGTVNLPLNSIRGNPNLLVGLGVKWDLYTGGEHQNKIKQVKLDQTINATKKEDTEEKLNLLLSKNKVNYTTGNQKLKVGEQQLKVAQNNLSMAVKQYQAGLIDVTELLATENEWYKVNLGYFNNVLQQRTAAVELLHTSGKLLQTIHE